MTAIAAVVHNGTVYMGADSQCLSGWVQAEMRQSKVWRAGQLLVGGCGSLRDLQVMRWAELPPPRGSFERWACVDLVAAFRKALRESKRLKKEHEVEQGDSIFLVGALGRIFTVHQDLSVLERREPFTATGSGQEYLLGALATTAHMEPRARLRAAVRAASRFDAGVGGAVRILSGAHA